MDFSRRDLAALNIMRGRDNGLADYNTVRRYFNLPEIKNWTQINPSLYARHPEMFDQLAELYDHNLEDVDAYVGGLVESEFEKGRPGELFRAIIKEQFVRIRDSDRFWFENTQNGIFSPEEIEEIKKIRFYDILVNATVIPPDAIQTNVFLFRENDPCPQPAQLSSKVLEPCLILAGWNYFHGSELPYILVILLLAFIPIGI
jgi:dual oxidase